MADDPLDGTAKGSDEEGARFRIHTDRGRQQQPQYHPFAWGQHYAKRREHEVPSELPLYI